MPKLSTALSRFSLTSKQVVSRINEEDLIQIKKTIEFDPSKLYVPPPEALIKKSAFNPE